MRRFKIMLSVFLVVLLTFPVHLFAQVKSASGYVSMVQGDVSLERDGKIIKPTVRLPLQVGDVIATKKGAKIQLTLNDDSVITINENTRFEIRQFIIEGNKRTGRFGLAVGSLVSDVKKYIGGDNVFEIHGPQAVAGVRGTVFVVTVVIGANGIPTMTVSVVSGLVSVASAAGSVIIGAGQMATVVGAGMPSVSAAAVTGAAAVTTPVETAATGAAAAATPAEAAAAGAGVTAGTATVGGVGVGTIAVGTVAAAAVIAGVAEATSGGTSTAHH
ncbi:MAG: FecR family protein [Syntrophales bacterium]|nr:FecR family protein [Syntrophales bacterium]